MQKAVFFRKNREKKRYAAWLALSTALNATGTPIYTSICPHSRAPDAGVGVRFPPRLLSRSSLASAAASRGGPPRCVQTALRSA